MGAVMRLVWDALLPALREEALPENSSAQAALAKRLAALQLPAPTSGLASPLADEVAGVIYNVSDTALGLRSISLESRDQSTALVWENEEGRQRVIVGDGDWIRTRVDSIGGLTSTGNELVEPPSGTVAAAAAGGWVDESTHVTRLCLYETPFYIDVTVRFAVDDVTINVEQNAAFGDRRVQPPRAGRRAR